MPANSISEFHKRRPSIARSDATAFIVAMKPHEMELPAMAWKLPVCLALRHDMARRARKHADSHSALTYRHMPGSGFGE
jgi:hypothetical protein